MKSFTHIVHLADIHVRLFKRHAEYKKVFETFYEQLRTIKNEGKEFVIVVAGDIAHAKTDMSPEMVQLISDFLKTLAAIAPTVVMAGNHDLNVANPHRMDALSPIIENLNNPNIRYYRESGVYQHENIDFAVMSLVGTQEEWPEASDCDPSQHRIALFHGPVHNAVTDVGYVITSRHASSTMFEGFDLALLGDIHKYQELQTNPPTVYPGSLIQQNHGESLRGHGFVLWDLSDYSYKHYEVPNDYGYYTIKVDDVKTPPDISDMPMNARLRIMAGPEVTENFIKKLVAVIRKRYNVTEVSMGKLVNANKGNAYADGQGIIVDVHNVDVQNQLITSYIVENFPNTSDEILEEIININTGLNLRIENDDLPRNVRWRPITMKFDNLFSYGVGNEVNFEFLTGLVGVFAPNASGKTSAFDALCFALYDKTPRAFKASHIMNTQEDVCSCELVIEIGETRYIIDRIGTRKKNKDVKVDVSFFRIESDGTQTCLNGEDRRATNAIIRSYVGDYEDFILTTLSVQNQNSLFIDKGQSDRKDLLSQFMGLTIFDKLWNLGTDDSKEIVGALKQFKKDDFTQRLVDLHNDIEDREKNYESGMLDVRSRHLDLKVIREQIELANKQIIPTTKTFGNYEEMLINRQKFLDDEVDVLILIEKLQDQLEFTRLDRLSTISKIADLKGIEDKYFEFDKLKLMKLGLDNEIKILESEEEHLERKLDKLSEHKYDPNCQYCMKNAELTILDTNETRSKLFYHSAQMAETRAQWSAVDAQITAMSQVESDYVQFKELSGKLAQLEQKCTGTELKIERENNKLKDVLSGLESVSRSIEEYDKNITTIESNKKLQDELKTFRATELKIAETVKKLDAQLLVQHGDIQVLRSKKEELMASIANAEELETKFESYELYLSAVSRDGISYQMISNTIPLIESEVNSILSQIVEFSVVMELDGKNINGKIVYGDDRVWPLELASGMEKFISSLAIRVALMQISNLPKGNFLILDEGLSVLDSENLPSMGMLFDLLKTKFDFVVLISHLDQVRDIADSLIEIKREGGYSYVNI